MFDVVTTELKSARACSNRTVKSETSQCHLNTCYYMPLISTVVEASSNLMPEGRLCIIAI